jgi:hypothetical protein
VQFTVKAAGRSPALERHFGALPGAWPPEQISGRLANNIPVSLTISTNATEPDGYVVRLTAFLRTGP